MVAPYGHHTLTATGTPLSGVFNVADAPFNR